MRAGWEGRGVQGYNTAPYGRGGGVEGRQGRIPRKAGVG